MNSRIWTRLQPAVAVLAALLVVPLLAPGGAGAAGSARLTLTALELSTIDSINGVRLSHGLAPLAISPALFGAASLHCRQMVYGGYFGHLGPDGSSFASRVSAYYPEGRYDFYSVGENLLWELGPMSSDAMVAKWMRSPEHRANLLNPGWREVGVSALTVRSAPGVYHDAPVTVVTVDFGVRR